MKLDLTDTSIYDDGLNRFEDKEIDFSKSINIIYGKNGTGKSSICSLMEEQWKDKEVCIFRGFNELLDENEKLNAIVLGEDNSKINKKVTSLEEEINKIEKELEEKRKNIEEPEGVDNRTNLFTEKRDLEDQKKNKLFEKEKIYQAGASDVKKEDNLSLITNGKQYDKNNFKNDLKEAKEQGELSKEEIKTLKETIPVVKKKDVNRIDLAFIDLKEERNRINSLLQKTVEPTENILELKDVQKQDFAKAGLGCHKPNENCAFCGNAITKERYEKVKRYFSSDDIKTFEKEIQKKLEFIKTEINLEVINIDEKLFYPEFQEKIKGFKEEIMLVAQGRKNILNSFKSSLEKNNQYTEDLEKKKKEACDKLRYHKINVFLKKESEKLESIKGDIQILEKEISIKASAIEKIKGEIADLKKQKEAKETSKKELLAGTKNTEILANNINEKIKGTVNFRLCRNKEEGEQEFYEIKEKIDGREETTRPITKLSDGEKNIIAFLYFIESLNEPDKKDREKIIVFDDPMNSNDDTMQYLITSEIENIVKSIYPNKKDKNIKIRSKDKLILLTHNTHFYRNNLEGLPGIYRDGGYSKYNIYKFRAINGKTIIEKIDKANKDINSSYQRLWDEVVFLYEHKKPNLMLNLIRQIIETFCSFATINKDDFYKKSPELKKLLNVNSHGIEDLEADLNGKTEEQIKNLFSEIFEYNGYKEHFDQLWGMYSSNKEKVSEETFEKLNDFCLSMIFYFDKKKKFYNMNDVFLEFIIRNLGDKNPKSSKCQREREFIKQMMNESLAAISKKENNNVANMVAVHQTFALLQMKR